MFTSRISLILYSHHKFTIEFIVSQIMIIWISVYTVILIKIIYSVISVCGSNSGNRIVAVECLRIYYLTLYVKFRLL
jgi:hypothetical protein